MGGGDEWFFGPCQDQSEANAENIYRRADLQDFLRAGVTKFATRTVEMFYLVENELAALNAIEADMAAAQHKNWVINQKQLNVFANQQPYFNFDTISSFLAMNPTSVKS